MTPERQKILAGEILDLSDKIDQDAARDYNVDLEDYMNLQKLAAILARQIAAFDSPQDKKDFIDNWHARPGTRATKKVRYTCEFEATVEFDPETEDEQDAICDIDIPEGGKNNSRYVENTFCLVD